MKLMKLITAFILLVCALGMTHAEVGLNMHFYNSQDDLSVGLAGEDLNFEGMAELIPDSLLYANGGASNDPECSYSYDITLNSKSLESGATTNSGAFGWHALVDRNSKGDGSSSFTLSAKSMVKNGILMTHEANPNINNQRQIYTNNAIYQQQSIISPNDLVSAGKGITLETNNQDTVANSGKNSQSLSTQDNPQVKSKGLLEVTTATGTENSATIVTNIHGDMNAEWKDKISSSSSQFSVGQAVVGLSNTWMSNLEMVGKATGFPEQRLPPGNLRVNIIQLETPEHQAIRELYRNEISSFQAKFPGSSVPLYYYIDERASIPPANQEDNIIPALSGESFKMNMLFNIND